MALHTFGSTTTSALLAIQWSASHRPAGVLPPADLAAFNAALLTPGPINPGQVPAGPCLGRDALLHLPSSRGIIRVRPGDWVVYDPTTGWPFVISQLAVSAGGSNWTHS